MNIHVGGKLNKNRNPKHNLVLARREESMHVRLGFLLTSDCFNWFILILNYNYIRMKMERLVI